MYAQLHSKSAYSLLESALSISQIVDSAITNKYSAVCLSDYKVMHKAIEFYQLCKKRQVKPLLGLSFHIEVNSTLLSISLIAKNNDGYLNLISLSSLLNERGVDANEFKEKSKNNIVIVDVLDTINDEYTNDSINKLAFTITELKSSVNDLYVGIDLNSVAIDTEYLFGVFDSLNIPMVAYPKAYYATSKDYTTLNCLKAIAENKLLSEYTDKDNNHYFKSIDVLNEMYNKTLISNTEVIANMCNVDLNITKAKIPHFETNSSVSSKEYLKQLTLLGLKKRLNNQLDRKYVDRLKYELNVIFKMNFEDYFLIVWDFIRYARTIDVYVGPGRGSSAGSLVAYVLGITHIDPLKYDLLFERFLNPERISLPDIDVDFPDNRREEIIEYVREKYSDERVAHIITFGTFKARQAIRDIGKALNLSIREIDMIAKSIPFQPNISLMEALDESKRFREFVEDDSRYTRLFELALSIENLPRHKSLHAAGIVLADKNLNNYVPTLYLDSDTKVTQYTMDYLEQFGLLKMDFLGLRNLTIIDEILNSIGNEIDILKIPLDDDKTIKLLNSVHTVGLFQLESTGMKSLLHKLDVSSFDDIVVAVALFRPGPMENIGVYLKAKNSKNIQYIHKDLEPILKSTYGVIIYQEQIMIIAEKVAGFTLAKADILRKAMSKKDYKILISLKDDFIKGSIAKGYSVDLATSIFSLIEKFANYGFNKAHSVAYALIAYQMAYLKANYPLEFMTSLLNSVIGSSSKTKEYLDECRNLDITVLPPSVNKSEDKYVVEDMAIRLPINIIKGVGVIVSESIIVERQSKLYSDFYDFIARANFRKINRKSIESLILAGALDEYNLGRQSMISSLNDAYQYAELVSIQDNQSQLLDLDIVEKPTPYLITEDVFVTMENEYELLGFYLTTHPIVAIKKKTTYQGLNIKQVKATKGKVSFLCFINKIKIHKTKNNQTMAFINVSDETGEIDLVLMPFVYDKYIDVLEKRKIIYVNGTIDKRDSVLLDYLQVVDY